MASMLFLSQLALEVNAQSPSTPEGPVGKSVQECTYPGKCHCAGI